MYIAIPEETAKKIQAFEPECASILLERGADWELVDLPDGVELLEDGDGGGENSPSRAVSRVDRAEKTLIYAALSRYRDHHGQGALKRLADLTGGKVTTSQLRQALLCWPLDITVWRNIGKALERAETK